MVRLFGGLALICLCFAQVILAINVDWDSTDSIKAAAKIVAKDMLLYFIGKKDDGTIGVDLLPRPYYWWEAGAMMGSLVDYWHYTGDTTYNSFTTEILQSQVGPHNDFMPPEQKSSLGNDDQAFWAMAAMSAAENKFPDPPDPKQPGWLSLVQAVFNEQVGRWDTSLCGGGLRWQIYEVTGYDLKNTISNGCLFNIAARLARYTGEQKYADWAVKLWDWMERIGLIDQHYNIFDNAEATKQNCTRLDRNQWTYNAGTMLMGAATMYNFTDGEPLWYNRTSSLLATIKFDFFPTATGGIMKEICEEYAVCNPDQKSFKAYLSRWMAASTKMAPFTYPTTYPLLLSSATAAAQQCTGGANGTLCGIKWWLNGTWDGTDGPGQQMCALETIQSTLIRHVDAPVTNGTGGTSVGNPDAGFNSSAVPPGMRVTPASEKERAGAWVLTAFMILGVVFMWGFMATNVFEGGGSTLNGKRARSSGNGGGAPGLFVAGMWKGKGRESGKAEPVAEVFDLGSRRSTMTDSRMSTMTGTLVGSSSVLEREGGGAAGVNGGGLKKMASSATILSPILEQKAVVVRAEGDGVEEKEGGVRSVASRASLPIWKGGDEKT